MLLRKVMEHVRQQNWLAVAIDFAIVVIGVYIGLQVSNWNDEVRLQSLERSYLLRVAEELRANIDEFEAEGSFARESSETLRDFIAVASDSSSTDAELVDHTGRYLTQGVFFAKFSPSRATFDELKSTGNLDIVEDRELRNALVDLHTFFMDGVAIRTGNEGWVEHGEAQVYMGFNALRYDARTSSLFPQESLAVSAQHIRDNVDLLIRHAALHYWIKDRTLEIIEEAVRRSHATLARLENAL